MKPLNFNHGDSVQPLCIPHLAARPKTSAFGTSFYHGKLIYQGNRQLRNIWLWSHKISLRGILLKIVTLPSQSRNFSFQKAMRFRTFSKLVILMDLNRMRLAWLVIKWSGLLAPLSTRLKGATSSFRATGDVVLSALCVAATALLHHSPFSL